MNQEDENIKNHIQAMNHLLSDCAKTQSQMIRELNRILIVVCICFTFIIVSMVIGFIYYEAQFDTKATTTTELTTEGDSANINSVLNGDMYNDDSTHNE